MFILTVTTPLDTQSFSTETIEELWQRICQHIQNSLETADRKEFDRHRNEQTDAYKLFSIGWCCLPSIETLQTLCYAWFVIMREDYEFSFRFIPSSQPLKDFQKKQLSDL